jgi:hypothetical protein
MPYRDTATLGQHGDTLAQRYEETIARLEQITEAGYGVDVMWECEFDRDILLKHAELRNHPLVQHTLLNTRDALYGGRTEAMSLHKKVQEGEKTLQYCEVMSIYPYICKYGKFLIGHPAIHVGDVCQDIDANVEERRFNEVFCNAAQKRIPSRLPIQM